MLVSSTSATPPVRYFLSAQLSGSCARVSGIPLKAPRLRPSVCRSGDAKERSHGVNMLLHPGALRAAAGHSAFLSPAGRTFHAWSVSRNGELNVVGGCWRGRPVFGASRSANDTYVAWRFVDAAAVRPPTGRTLRQLLELSAAEVSLVFGAWSVRVSSLLAGTRFW